MLNTPVTASDPSGHKCVGKIEECLDKGRQVNGVGGLRRINKENDKDDKELTSVELIGQAVTVGMIELFILLPVDIALAELTVDGVSACLGGFVPACVVDIPLGALDVIVADFQISLFNTVSKNFSTKTRHEFEWLIIPSLFNGNANKGN